MCDCTVLDSHKWIVTLVLEWRSRSCGGAFSAGMLLYGSDSVRCITVLIWYNCESLWGLYYSPSFIRLEFSLDCSSLCLCESDTITRSSSLSAGEVEGGPAETVEGAHIGAVAHIVPTLLAASGDAEG